MTKQEALEWAQSHTDDDVLDQAELEEAFTALYERPPDNQDREEGLWSLICCMDEEMFQCRACEQYKPMDELTNDNIHYTGGEQRICLACHIEIIESDSDLSCSGCLKLHERYL